MYDKEGIMTPSMYRVSRFIIVAIISVLSGCTRSQSVLSGPATASPPPTATPPATATPATPAPMAGALWDATAPKLGTFEFTTDTTHTDILDMILHIHLTCNNVQLSLDPTDVQGSWPITHNHISFDIVPANSVLDLKLTGTFDPAFQKVTGTWMATVFGGMCLGTWQGYSTS
jgi:hypothetical protein